MAAPAAEPVLFHSVTLGRRPRSLALAGSIAIHGLVMVLMMGLSDYVLWTEDDHFDWARYTIQPLRLHLSEPLYFKANPHAETPDTKGSHLPEQAVGRGQSSTAATISRAPLVPHHVQLPAPHEIAKDGPTIIQPDLLPPVVAMPRALPPLAFWARQGVKLPKPPPRSEVVVPGRTEALSAPPKLAAPPMPAVPNREQAVADKNVALPTAPVVAPALPVPNSATMPVRLRNLPGAEAASLDQLSGQPANVIALPVDRVDARDVEIPKGLQNIPRLSAAEAAIAAGANGTPGANAETRNSNSSGSGQAAESTGAVQNGNSARGGHGTAPGPSAPVDTTGSQGSSGVGGHPGEMTGTRAVVIRPVAPPEVTRIEHPSNGNFDVVIMQSGPRADLPDLGGMLTGNPVYTVFLRVGDQKEWLLEYCVPVRQNIQASSYEVNVDDAGSVTPPYPISTAIPNTILGHPSSKHIVLHGVLAANGTLQDVKGLETNSGFLNQLLAALTEWQFRPALRNKKPIDVEILLVIPPRV